MWFHYLQMGWRHLRRRPFYSFLKLAGLSLGVAAVLYIGLYVDFERNYDRFHTQAENIYRVNTVGIQTRDRHLDVDWQSVPGPLGLRMKEDYPAVKEVFRSHGLFPEDEAPLKFGDKEIDAERLGFVDASILDVFTFEWLGGDRLTALTGPNKIVLSQSLAKRIFGDEDPIGKVITAPSPFAEAADSVLQLMVSGLYQDMPRNAHWRAEGMISAETDPGLDDYYYNSFAFPTYALLEPGADPAQLEKQISEIYDRYLDKNREPVMVRAEHHLQPLTEIHLDQSGGATYLYIFGAVGLLMLLIAGISYLNLTTAQASQRGVEVGLRKTLGSNRKQLIGQFLGESFVLTGLAILVGITLLEITIPLLNEWLGLQVQPSDLLQLHILGSLLGIWLILGLAGGSYAAFFLSAFQPSQVLKGHIRQGKGRTFTRKALVGLQFAVVIFVLVCTTMVFRQLSFIQQKNLGFDQEQMVRLNLPPGQRIHQIQAFHQVLRENPHVIHTTATNFVPGWGGLFRAPLAVETPEGYVQKFTRRGWVDTDFWESMDIPVVTGRNFSADYPTDSTQGVIINEALVQDFNLQEPLGTIIRLGDQGNPNFLRVVGVVRDFHQQSLHSPIEPQVTLLGDRDLPLMLVKIDELEAGLAHIQRSWQEVFPTEPFAYQFVDELMQEMYETDQRRGEIFLSFSVLTLFICFLGLFGLASYLSVQRIKEIGIRKILGASVWGLVQLLSKEYIWLVLLAALPAMALAQYTLQRWLENFAFQTDMHYGLFGLVLLFVLVFTFAVAAFHALRTARLNPAVSLRDE
ncbi:MAG: ABC transporter permease [Bacteroidota bacterium]